MDILITNDDGYFSQGIKLLKDCLEGLGHDCTVVAPQNQKSGVSSALTLFEPIFLYENSKNEPPETKKTKEYYISGTPVDCVKVALNQLLEKKPDLLISGINHGANIGINVIYSGTVGAAFEGLFNDIPSIAISLDSNHSHNFELIKSTLRKLLIKMFALDLGKDTVWNVNLPAVAEDEVKGIQFTKMSRAYFQDRYERREDLRGRSYFWLGENAEILLEKDDLHYDSVALRNGFISITPLTYDMTNQKRFDAARQMDW